MEWVEAVKPTRKPSSLEVPTPPSDEAEVEGETKTGGHELLRVVGPYRLVAELGRGGAASVHKGVGSDAVPVAVKLMLEPDHNAARRFEREAKVLRELGQHAHIVALIDHGLADGLFYIAMELVDGTDLTGWLETHPSLTERITLLAQVVEAIEFAHLSGVLHRDIKPSNVLVTRDGQPRVTDFGTAKELDPTTTGATATTGTGGILGTLAYMSPEQTSGERLDQSSDVFSLGVMLYEVLCGQLPFRGTPAQVLTQIVRKTPEAPRAVDPSVPADLSAVCLKALAKDPAARYESAAALATDLRRWLAGARPLLGRPAWRRPLLIALLLLVVAVAVVAVAWHLPA